MWSGERAQLAQCLTQPQVFRGLYLGRYTDLPASAENPASAARSPVDGLDDVWLVGREGLHLGVDFSLQGDRCLLRAPMERRPRCCAAHACMTQPAAGPRYLLCGIGGSGPNRSTRTRSAGTVPSRAGWARPLRWSHRPLTPSPRPRPSSSPGPSPNPIGRSGSSREPLGAQRRRLHHCDCLLPLLLRRFLLRVAAL